MSKFKLVVSDGSDTPHSVLEADYVWPLVNRIEALESEYGYENHLTYSIYTEDGRQLHLELEWLPRASILGVLP